MNTEPTSENDREVLFTTFGMFIIDEIEWQTKHPPPPKKDLIGGAGTYAILGARLVVGGEMAKSISWIVDVGSDFPPQIKTSIDSWKTGCIYRHDANRRTTRAWNGYGLKEHRSFRYLTPKRRLEVRSLNPVQLMARAFHMVCSPERCKSLVDTLTMERRRISSTKSMPVVIWEPIPDLCKPEELSNLHEAASNCTVISPNDDELRMFFPHGAKLSQDSLVPQFIGWTQPQSSNSSGWRCSPVPVVREGAKGSTAYFQIPASSASSPKVTSLHVNAYHTPSLAHAVVDPTGGGNTYLGALGVSLTDAVDHLPTTSLITGMLRGKDPCQILTMSEASQQGDLKAYLQRMLVAMIYATIAASYAIEQHGVPLLLEGDNETANCDQNRHGWREIWNGDAFIDRLDLYLIREETALKEQLAAIDRVL